MRVLLTGATGFIGSYVLKELLEQGLDIVVVGRSRPLDSSVDFIEADLLAKEMDFDNLVKEASATHLLHLAWYAEHGKYWTSPLNLRWVNASVKLVEAFCQNGGKKVVISGTCAEYDWSYGYCQEDVTPLNPATLYGISKDATRRLSQAICREYEVDFVWGRVFFAYGEGEPESRLIPSLKRVFQDKQEPFSVSTELYRDFIHVSDVARAFVKLLIAQPLGCYNICTTQPLKIEDIVTVIAKDSNSDPGLVLNMPKNKADEVKFLIGDNDKLVKLGWLPNIALNFIKQFK